LPVKSLPDGLTYKTKGVVDSALAMEIIGMTNPTDKTTRKSASVFFIRVDLCKEQR
jgi:hypothetical protein